MMDIQQLLTERAMYISVYGTFVLTHTIFSISML